MRLLPLLLAPLLAGGFSVKDDFFIGYIKPDNSVAFGYHNPSAAEETQLNDMVWWEWVAKHTLLMKTPKYRKAYDATAADPDLQSTGMTFKAFAGASQEEKAAMRLKLEERISATVAKHGLLEMLIKSPVDPKELAETKDSLRHGTHVIDPLIRYCPGADGNIAFNPSDPDYPKLRKLRDDPTRAPLYDAALKNFWTYVDQNPSASIEERTIKLNKLVKPLLTQE